MSRSLCSAAAGASCNLELAKHRTDRNTLSIPSEEDATVPMGIIVSASGSPYIQRGQQCLFWPHWIINPSHDLPQSSGLSSPRHSACLHLQPRLYWFLWSQRGTRWKITDLFCLAETGLSDEFRRFLTLPSNSATARWKRFVFTIFTTTLSLSIADFHLFMFRSEALSLFFFFLSHVWTGKWARIGQCLKCRTELEGNGRIRSGVTSSGPSLRHSRLRCSQLD